MDWQRVDFDWNHVRAFLATADEGSYSAAARTLGIAQPTVGRQVAALEAELGVTLFERDGRGLGLTASGLELVEHVRAMSEAAFRVSRIAAGQAVSLAGRICITASDVVATYLLPPVVAKLPALHPLPKLENHTPSMPCEVTRISDTSAVSVVPPKAYVAAGTR
mgnify:CR=1 FL=1